MSENEPFRRQPQPVTVTIKGEPEDVQYWLRDLMRRAGFKFDMFIAGQITPSSTEPVGRGSQTETPVPSEGEVAKLTDD